MGNLSLLAEGASHAGNTSLVKALAGQLGLSIFVLALSSPNLSDDTLRELLNRARNRGVLLLEDVDVALRRPGAPWQDDDDAGGDGSAPEGGADLSFSGLLNALDGVAVLAGQAAIHHHQLHRAARPRAHPPKQS